ncbi:MAG: response regulator [Planctomycetes bacterium]|nr:response regulator [Planctomycetota bacterium]
MPRARLIDAGNCDLDHGNLCRVLAEHFQVDVRRAHSQDQALGLLREQGADLLVVNRVFDADGSDAMQLIQTIKSDPNLAAVPVMLVTNFPEHQQRAVAAGAVPGYGKRELGSQEMLARLRPFLNKPPQ